MLLMIHYALELDDFTYHSELGDGTWLDDER